jgi:DNA polymerase-3 subunit epsilon
MDEHPSLAPFAALDFETADYRPDSACALAVVRVEEGEIVARKTLLLRPPRRRIMFTYIHGIRWEHVQDAPTFEEAWHEFAPLLEGVRFLAAHNASFDRAVLSACQSAAGLTPVRIPFLCTVRLARACWELRSAALPNVCRFLDLPLNHHEAGSDAEACASIVLAAWLAGFPLARMLPSRMEYRYAW